MSRAVGPQHSVRMTPAEWAHVERLAEVADVSRSEAVRRIVQADMAASPAASRTPEETPNV